MKPVIEANFKPFESVRFRQNASLVSKDQLAARQHQAISQYRLKARQAQNHGISSPESMTCIQNIRQAFDLQDTVQRVHGTANVSGSGNSFGDPFSGSPDNNGLYTLQRGEFEFRVASGDLEYIPALEMTIITSYPEVEFIYPAPPIMFHQKKSRIPLLLMLPYKN